MANLKALLRVGGNIYISQSVPGQTEFYGKDLFPNPVAILDHLAQSFGTIYASSTQEMGSARVHSVYDIDQYARFLGIKN